MEERRVYLLAQETISYASVLKHSHLVLAIVFAIYMCEMLASVAAPIQPSNIFPSSVFFFRVQNTILNLWITFMLGLVSLY